MTESDDPMRPAGKSSAQTKSPLETNVPNWDADCEQRLDEIADLITRVRYEINNPLTGVLGQAQLLLREDLSESARRRVTTIEEQAIRIRDIVAQLRQVQKGPKT